MYRWVIFVHIFGQPGVWLDLGVIRGRDDDEASKNATIRRKQRFPELRGGDDINCEAGVDLNMYPGERGLSLAEFVANRERDEQPW